MLRQLRLCWLILRRVSGDDAYERYLERYAAHQEQTCEQGCETSPLTKKEFFKRWQDEKWQGIKRCC